MGFQWDDPFGIAKRRARRRAELEQHLRFVRTNNFDVIRLDCVYQKARTGEKGYGLHVHSGQPCDIWFPGAWPDAKRSILCKGFGVGRGLSLYGGITTASLFSMSIESLGRFRGKSGGLGSDKLPHTSYGLCVVEFLKNK